MEELYNEFADLAALNRVKVQVLEIFGEIRAGIKGLNDLGIKIDGAASVKSFASAQEAYNAYIKDTDRLKKNLLDTEKRLYESERQYATIIAANKVELQKRNRELKLEAEYQAAASNTREKAMAGVRLFNFQRNQLNQYNEVEKVQYDQLTKKIEIYDSFLTKTASSLEKLKRNVGNYAGSLAQPFETLSNKLDEIRANLDKGIGIGGTDEAALQRSAQAISIIETTLEKSTKAGATAERQVRNLSAAYQGLSITFQNAPQTETGFLGKLREQVGVAKDDVADLKDELKLQASDTKGIDNVVGSLNALAGIAQGAAGAMALLGDEGGDANRQIAKLIAIQGIANSVQQVGQELTRKGTIANKAYEGVLNLVTTATNASATATTRFAAAGKLLLGGLLIGGITYLIVKYIEMKNAISDAARQSQLLSDINKEIANQAGAEISKLDSLYKVATNNTLAIKDRKKAVDELQKQYPEYFKNINDEIILQGKAAGAYDKAKEAILAKAKTQAIEGELAKLATKELQAQFDIEENLQKLRTARPIVDAARKKASSVKGDPKGIAADTGPESENLQLLLMETKRFQDKIDDANKDLAKIQKDREFLLGKITTPDVKTDGGEKVKAELKKINDNTAEAILKSNYELAKQKIQREQETDREVMNDENKTFDERLSALKSFTAAQIQLIDIEQKYEIAAEKLRLAKVIESLEEEKKATLKNKDLSGSEKIKQIKLINQQEAKEREASTKAIAVIEGKGFDNLVNATKEFNAALKKLKDERQNLRKEEQDQIDDYEKFTQDQIDKARQAQLDGEKAYQAKRQAAIDNANKNIKASMKQLYKELLDTLLFFLTASIDKQVAQLDTQKRLLDEDTQRRINQINQLGLAESDRVKETAKVEKQAQYESEQIERKKRRLAVERARFEKFANIAGIIANTAAAVVGALKPDGFTPIYLRIALAAIIGGIGALQLARAIAAPLPQYAKGTDSAAPGKAVVSEEGPELMKRNGKWYLTPDRESVIDMQGGEQIIPARLSKDIMNSVSLSHQTAGGLMKVSVSGMTERQANKIIDELVDLKHVTEKSRIFIKNEHGIESTPYYLKNIR